ncbi:MAG: hypothetical protein ACFFH0_10630 [Promethearchaeota archaeon]
MTKNKKAYWKLLKPIIWFITKILELIPSYGNAIKAINIEREVRKLEKVNNYEKARKIRTEFLNKYPVKYLGPLWRSEGMDQLYNLENYEKALEAFENAIVCIEGNGMICAFQYGVTDPLRVYCGAATAAIYVSDGRKARVYYDNFRELASRSSSKEKYREQLDWLKTNIGDSASKTSQLN